MADAHAKPHTTTTWSIRARGRRSARSRAFVLAVGRIAWMHHMFAAAPLVFGAGVLGVLYTMLGWWRDVIREAEHEGYHTRVVQISHRYGMILFIASEVMFFVAWFWAYFDAALFPGDAIDVGRVAITGGVWPPKGIETFDPWHLPLLNTLILLTSGTTVTWAHHALLHNDRKGLNWGLVLTILLGLTFTCVQAYEYSHAAFPFSRQHLRRDLLHGDRLPRLPRDHRHDLPDRLPDPRHRRPLHAASSISASSSPPGTGTSSTWCGCSCSPASMCGAPGRRIRSDDCAGIERMIPKSGNRFSGKIMRN